MRLRAPAVAVVVGLLAWGGLPAAGLADIYRCEGPDGSVHFTNSRPRGPLRCRVVVKERKKKAKAPRRAAGTSGASRNPERYQRYDSHIREAARLYQLPETFIRAVMRVESDFTPHVVSHAGAMGLMQLMPRTAAAMGVRNPFDPRQNILGGARYLRLLANKFNGDLVLTIAAYNAGEGAVMRYRGVPPYRETRRYVRRVLQHYYRLRGSGGARAAASSAARGM